MNTLFVLSCTIVLSCLAIALAFDPSPMQDYCIADLTSSMRVNGFPCKDPKLAQASDFSFSGLHIARNTSNKLGLTVTPVSATQLPGLNTLGISVNRIDYAPWGISPPHVHPRATEVTTVLEGTLEVGFVTSNPDNRLITKVLYEGDVFVFPIGLIHFARNIGKFKAVAISAFSSQNPGINVIANVVFKSNPTISSDILAKAFQVDKKIVETIESSI